MVATIVKRENEAFLAAINKASARAILYICHHISRRDMRSQRLCECYAYLVDLVNAGTVLSLSTEVTTA